MLQPSLTLNNGHRMPQVGFGLWQVPQEETPRVVAEALQLGYRLVDGAAIYGNERGLGEGLRRSGLPRDQLFVTTKVWNDRQGYDTTLTAVENSLGRLGLDWLDLCLIHWPVPSRNLFVDTWRALIRLRDEGRVRSIGVSNFRAEDLDRLVSETGVIPALNQVELHPRLQQAHLREKHEDLGIVTQSWTPLGRGRSFDDPCIASIARRLGQSPAQVILRWHLQLGCSVIPRSIHKERLAENLDLFDFALTAEDMADIARLDTGERTGPDPSTFE